MAAETTKTLKFDTSNLAKKGELIIPLFGSLSYASHEIFDNGWEPQGAYYQEKELPDVYFIWNDHHLVVNIGLGAIKYIAEHQVKEIEVVLKNK